MENSELQTEKILTVIQETEILGRKIELYGSVENPLFLAKDVAEWIEYSKSNGKYKIHQMLNTVEEEEKGVYKVATPGGTQNVWFLTEEGLYEICMQSRKPIAKELKHEIKKYLKSIRLTGAAIEDEQKTVDYYFANFSDNLKAQIFHELYEKNKELQRFYDDLLNTKGLKPMNIVSKELNGFGLKKLYSYLRSKGIMFYKDKINIPYQRFMDQGLFKVKESMCSDGKMRPVTYATNKGLEYIRKKLREDGLLQSQTTIQ